MAIFFHLTSINFKKGDMLLPQEDGYSQLEMNSAMEEILEGYRPENKISRTECVYLFAGSSKRAEKCDFGATGLEFICLCSAPDEILEQKSDLNWIFPLDQEFESVEDIYDQFTEDELEDIATGYWSGNPMPGKTPVFEYRSESARVRHCVPNKEESHDLFLA
jgi:hypothetical protein